ncbi:unnamed protein product [Linum trigynum]|uniref:Uncharacterized protein n=1 Tax=Linum trigynum TaxID=586398 RepID=A0AAV2EZ94_9ROSI
MRMTNNRGKETGQTNDLPPSKVNEGNLMVRRHLLTVLPDKTVPRRSRERRPCSPVALNHTKLGGAAGGTSEQAASVSTFQSRPATCKDDEFHLKRAHESQKPNSASKSAEQ